MFRNRFVIAASFISLTSMAGCGGGTTSLTPIPTQAPLPTSLTFAVPTQPQTLAVLAGTVTESIVVPAAASGTGTITIVGSSSLPAGDPPLSTARRSGDDRSRFAATPGVTPIAFLTATATATDTFAAFPTFTYTIPSGLVTAAQSYYLAILAPGSTAFIEPVAGPGVVGALTGGASSISFCGTSGIVSAPLPLTLAAGATYTFALYAIATPIATASPSTSAAPIVTASPSAAPSVVPSATATATATPTATPTVAPTPTIAPTPTVAPTPSASATASANPNCLSTGPGMSSGGSSAPTISSLSPTCGAVGDTVVITGTNFVAPLSIVFAGNASAAGTFTSTKITVTVPSGAQSGSIVVNTANGSATTPTFTVTVPSPTPS